MYLRPKSSVDAWIVIVGTAASGSLNTLLDVTKSSDLTQFGAAGTGTLVNALTVALRYGIKAIAIRVATGANAAETATNIIGTANTTGLGLVATIEPTTGRYPIAIVVPGISDTGVVTALESTASAAGTTGVIDFIGTVANLNTARATSTGYGLKSDNLAITFPALLNSSTTEYLSSHLGALMARAYKLSSFGVAPTGETLLNITGITPSVTASEVTALNNNGVISIENVGTSYRLKGFTNSLYPSNTGQDSLLMRTLVEGIITRAVRARIAQRMGQLINLQTARVIGMELTSYLSALASSGHISQGYAIFNEADSSFTGTTANLSYTICVTLKSASAIVSTFTFTVVA